MSPLDHISDSTRENLAGIVGVVIVFVVLPIVFYWLREHSLWMCQYTSIVDDILRPAGLPACEPTH